MDKRQQQRHWEDNEKLARMTLLIAIITSFAGTFAASAINLTIPAVSVEFRSGSELTGWIITGFLLGNVVFSVPVYNN